MDFDVCRRQFLLLTWKNLLHMKRNITGTVALLFINILFPALLLLSRKMIKPNAAGGPIIESSFELTTGSDNLISYGHLGFTPNNIKIRNIIERAAKLISDTLIIEGYENEHDLEIAIQNSSNIRGGIVFLNTSFIDRLNNLSANITYKVRLKENYNSWLTEVLMPTKLNSARPRQYYDTKGGHSPGYFVRGFLSIQKAVDASLIAELGGNISSMKTFLKKMAFLAQTNDYFYETLLGQLSTMTMFGLFYMSSAICSEVVAEKQQKLKEYMKLLGMRNWVYWASWFFKYLTLAVISAILIIIIYHVNFGVVAILSFTSPTITFLLIFLYSMATITFFFALTTMFNKGRIASFVGMIFFFVTYGLEIYLQTKYDSMNATNKLLISLFPNIALGLGCRIIALSEASGRGVQWGNIDQSYDLNDHFSLLCILVMLFVDVLLYGIVTWYLDAVHPGEYGSPKPFYFPFQKKYWCGLEVNPETEKLLQEHPNYGSRTEFFEPNSPTSEIGIKIRNLTKTFKKKSKPAVNGLNLDICDNSITSLLGHNGAGKTTTLCMLTGFTVPSKGDASINNFSIIQNMDIIRQSLGYCPQENILFDNMTVMEHLTFFAKLKGSAGNDVDSDIKNMLTALFLMNKKDTLSKNLSGGMKRKLSIAIALIGKTKFVILDEPTSGLDPEARREIWDVLKSHQEGRTMILTTHYMDEADYLGDKIAIMAEGVIQCYGSSMFLKKKYGIGYHLTIMKTDDCKVSNIHELITSKISDSQLKDSAGSELTYQLPKESSSEFPSLFLELETNGETLGIDNFGVSVTTLEEVFIRVGELCEHEEEQNDGDKTGINEAINLSETKSCDFMLKDSADDDQFKLKGNSLTMAKIGAMVYKKMIYTCRNLSISMTQILVPVALVVFVCITSQPSRFKIPKNESPPFKLDLTKYDHPITVYGTTSPPSKLLECFRRTLDKIQGSNVYLNENGVNYTNETDMDDYFVKLSKENLLKYRMKYPIAAEIGPDYLMGLYNDESYHTIAISLSLIDNTWLQCLTKPFNDTINYEINTINHPIARPSEESNEPKYRSSAVGHYFAFVLTYGLICLVSTFCVFLINERITGAKFSQYVSGATSYTFWIAAFVWDVLNYLVPVIFIIVVVMVTNVGKSHYFGICLLVSLMTFGWAAIPLVYLLSFLFSKSSTGYNVINTLLVVSGLVTMIVMAYLQGYFKDNQDVPNTVEYVFYALFPIFCIFKNLQHLFNSHAIYDKCSKEYDLDVLCSSNASTYQSHCCLFQDNYLAWKEPGSGRPLMFMAVQGIFFFIILFIVESDFSNFIKRKLYSKVVYVDAEPEFGSLIERNDDDDDDVQDERLSVLKIQPHEFGSNENILILKQLFKKYGLKTLAVNNISVKIPMGECFGLLGVNGAGKTSTFKMLTGEETISEGEIYIKGINVARDLTRTRQYVGYCPQFDSLIDQLTVQEHLELHARLRGIPRIRMKRYIHEVMQKFNIVKNANKKVKTLSGGNKRKLCVAISLLGRPALIFLDEPTTGIDPVARRELWNLLSSARRSGSTLVLTSHSMEECEALCTRQAIMVNGQFKCLGSTQHLKTKFGSGYSVSLKAKQTQDQMANTDAATKIKELILNHFPGSILEFEKDGLINFRIERSITGATVANIFKVLEDSKEMFEDYSVGQATLEQIFINFARTQRLPVQEPKIKLFKFIPIN